MSDQQGSQAFVGASDFRVRYDAFIAGLHIQGIRISDADIKAPHPYGSEPHRQLEGRVATSNNYANMQGGFFARSTLAFDGVYADEEQPRVSIKVTVEVGYLAAVPMSDDIFEVFGIRNLPLNTWPYLREFVQSALVRAGWPVYTLPAFKPAPLQLQLNLPSGT
ncbi:MAG: hypothetical protein ABIS27_07260 [Longimicrobiales bacterium]